MIQLVCDKKDITRYAEQITWSGDIQQCYRSVSVKLRDGIRPECGDKVVLYENGKALFSAMCRR